MNKEEIKEWVEENNPYGNEHPCKNCSNNMWNQCQTNPIDCERYKELTDFKDGWAKGARAMSEHLQSQPPTKEQIEKVLDLFFWACDTYFPDNNEQEQYIDYIIKNWKNE